MIASVTHPPSSPPSSTPRPIEKETCLARVAKIALPIVLCLAGFVFLSAPFAFAWSAVVIVGTVLSYCASNQEKPSSPSSSSTTTPQPQPSPDAPIKAARMRKNLELSTILEASQSTDKEEELPPLSPTTSTAQAQAPCLPPSAITMLQGYQHFPKIQILFDSSDSRAKFLADFRDKFPTFVELDLSLDTLGILIKHKNRSNNTDNAVEVINVLKGAFGESAVNKTLKMNLEVDERHVPDWCDDN